MKRAMRRVGPGIGAVAAVVFATGVWGAGTYKWVGKDKLALTLTDDQVRYYYNVSLVIYGGTRTPTDVEPSAGDGRTVRPPSANPG